MVVGEGGMMRTVAVHELTNLVNHEVSVSDWFLITQERVNQFAEATGDYQWIHVDVERASRELEGTIAHGFLILSLIPHLCNNTFEITGLAHGLNYGLNRVRFTGVTKVGSRIRLRIFILNVETKSNGILVNYKFTVEREEDERPVCIAEALWLVVPQ